LCRLDFFGYERPVPSAIPIRHVRNAAAQGYRSGSVIILNGSSGTSRIWMLFAGISGTIHLRVRMNLPGRFSLVFASPAGQIARRRRIRD
jgi:hypothetical protein